MDSHYPARMLFILGIIREGGTYIGCARLDDDVTTHTDTNIIKEDFLVFFLSFLFVFNTYIFFSTIR